MTVEIIMPVSKKQWRPLDMMISGNNKLKNERKPPVRFVIDTAWLRRADPICVMLPYDATQCMSFHFRKQKRRAGDEPRRRCGGGSENVIRAPVPDRKSTRLNSSH